MSNYFGNKPDMFSIKDLGKPKDFDDVVQERLEELKEREANKTPKEKRNEAIKAKISAIKMSLKAPIFYFKRLLYKRYVDHPVLVYEGNEIRSEGYLGIIDDFNLLNDEFLIIPKKDSDMDNSFWVETKHCKVLSFKKPSKFKPLTIIALILLFLYLF